MALCKKIIIQQGFLHILISVNRLKTVEVMHNLQATIKCGASRQCFFTQKCKKRHTFLNVLISYFTENFWNLPFHTKKCNKERFLIILDLSQSVESYRSNLNLTCLYKMWRICYPFKRPTKNKLLL